MTLSDYILDLALIGVVLLQLRERRLTLRGLLLPLAIVGYFAAKYLKSVPTSGNDLWLIGLCAATGAALGVGAGLATRVYRRDGLVLTKAGATAAVLWVAGVGGRLAFQLYATHGGGPSIGRFSLAHGISLLGQQDAWVPAMILMALSEVVARVVVIAGRAYRVHPGVFTASPRPAIMGAGERA